MYSADTLASEEWPLKEHPLGDGKGVWLRAQPEPDPFLSRAKDAWEVLRGRAIAVKFAKKK